MNAKSRPNRTIKATQTVDKVHGERRGFFWYTTSTMIAIYALIIRFLNTQQQTVMDTGNIKAAERSVKAVHILSKEKWS